MLWKAIEKRHYEHALTLQAEAREQYIVSLVEAWDSGAIAKESDFEGLTPAEVEEIVKAFEAMFEEQTNDCTEAA